MYLQVRIKLTKKEPDWWPRLLFEQKKLPWLRLDFDRIKQESETEEVGFVFLFEANADF